MLFLAQVSLRLNYSNVTVKTPGKELEHESGLTSCNARLMMLCWGPSVAPLPVASVTGMQCRLDAFG